MLTSPFSMRMTLLNDHSMASATWLCVSCLASRALRSAWRTRWRASAGVSAVDLGLPSASCASCRTRKRHGRVPARLRIADCKMADRDLATQTSAAYTRRSMDSLSASRRVLHLSMCLCCPQQGASDLTERLEVARRVQAYQVAVVGRA